MSEAVNMLLTTFDLDLDLDLAEVVNASGDVDEPDG